MYVCVYLSTCIYLFIYLYLHKVYLCMYMYVYIDRETRDWHHTIIIANATTISAIATNVPFIFLLKNFPDAWRKSGNPPFPHGSV